VCSVARIRLPLLLVLLCAHPLFAQGAAAPERKQIQLVVWYDGPTQDLQGAHDLVWMYQQFHPDALVHLVPGRTADAYKQMLEWCGNKAAYAPDMVVIPDTWLPEFDRFFENLGRLIQARAVSAVAPPVLGQLRVGQSLRAVPWRVDTRLVFVRKDLRETKRLDPARSWVDATRVAAALHDPPRLYGMGLPGSVNGDGAASLLDLFWALGGTMAPQGGRIAADADKITDALGSYMNAAASSQPETLTWTQAEVEDAFVQGRLACVVSDSGFAERLTKSGVKFAWEVCPFAKDGEGSGDVTVQALAVFRSGKYVREAVEFAEMLLGERGQELMMKNGGVPATLPLIRKWRDDPKRAAFVANIDRGSGVGTTAWPSLKQVLGHALYVTASGRAFATDAAADAVAALGGAAPEAPTPPAPEETPPAAAMGAAPAE
jgi:hypothetical protein